MRITTRFIRAAFILSCAIPSATLIGCDDPCADLSDRCDQCEGNDEDLCSSIVDGYDYEACDDALATDLCHSTSDAEGESEGGGGGGS